VQLLDPFKEILARQFRQQRAGVGIEINRFALALARRGARPMRALAPGVSYNMMLVMRSCGLAARRQHDLLRSQHRRVCTATLRTPGLSASRICSRNARRRRSGRSPSGPCRP
jgi:hypothetical protein